MYTYKKSASKQGLPQNSYDASLDCFKDLIPKNISVNKDFESGKTKAVSLYFYCCILFLHTHKNVLIIF